MVEKLTAVKKKARESNAGSLVALAEKRALPRFQYMDEITHRWMLRNNPNYAVDSPSCMQSSDVSWLNTMTLPPEWFLERRIIDSLHGLRHLLRTAYLATCLIDDMPDRETQVKNVAVAALIHDIRRRDDKGDSGHAERSACWFRKHAGEVALHLALDLSPADIVSIEAAIELHEVPHSDFTARQKKLYRGHATLIDTLKTADALDRYRLPKLKWWIDDAYLRLVPSLAMKQMAFDLVAVSEGNFLRLKDGRVSVLSAVKYVRSRYNPSHAHWHNAHIFYGTYRRGL